MLYWQVNVYIIAKPYLIRRTIILEVIMKCLGPKYCVRNMCLLHYFFLFVFLLYLVYLVALHSTIYSE